MLLKKLKIKCNVDIGKNIMSVRKLKATLGKLESRHITYLCIMTSNIGKILKSKVKYFGGETQFFTYKDVAISHKLFIFHIIL